MTTRLLGSGRSDIADLGRLCTAEAGSFCMGRQAGAY